MRVQLVRMGAKLGGFHVVTLADGIDGAELVFFDHRVHEATAMGLTRENVALKSQLHHIGSQLEQIRASSGEIVRVLVHLIDRHLGGSAEVPRSVLTDSEPLTIYRGEGTDGSITLTTTPPEAEGGDDDAGK